MKSMPYATTRHTPMLLTRARPPRAVLMNTLKAHDRLTPAMAEHGMTAIKHLAVNDSNRRALAQADACPGECCVTACRMVHLEDK